MIDFGSITQQVQQVAQAGGSMLTFEWLLRVIIVPLIFGNYVYTWLASNSLRKELRYLKDNHLHEVNKRLSDLEKKG